MRLVSFDHVNIRTANLEAMIAWYAEMLGLHPGPRPDFGFPGAWLYLGAQAQALVHLVGVEQAPRADGDLALEHFAFRAEGLDDLLARLTKAGVPHRIARIPGGGPVQVNLHDPDGNHIHIDFDPSEEGA